MKAPFVRCQITCSFCGNTIAQTRVIGRTIPRRTLYRQAFEEGSVRDHTGSMFCNAACRMNHRLEHGAPHLETPTLDDDTKSR